MTRRSAHTAALAVIAACAIPALRHAEPVTARLATADRTFADGAHYRRYLLDVRRGDTVTALLSSDDFDAMLVLEGWFGTPLAEDDDGGGDCNARLTYVAGTRTSLNLYATSSSGAELGEFRLEVVYGTPPPPPADTTCRGFGSVAGTLRVGWTVPGSLEAGDPELADGSYFERWTLPVVPGRAFTVDVRSADLDPHVTLVRGRDTELAADDDSGPGCGARLSYTAPDSRPLRVVVGSSGTGRRTGEYSLSVRPGTFPRDSARDCQLGVDVAANRKARRIAVGDSAAGELTPADRRLPRDGSYAQWWRVAGAAGRTVTIDLISAAFDAYLVVTGPGLVEPLEDDDSGGRCHARVTLTFSQSADYDVIVNSATAGATGPFLLRVLPLAPPPVAGACRPG